MAGRTAPAGMPVHAEFVAGVAAALDHLRERHAREMLIVSSGGPIPTAVGPVLGLLGPTAVIDLNPRLRSSVVSFNGIPHLEAGVPAAWITDARGFGPRCMQCVEPLRSAHPAHAVRGPTPLPGRAASGLPALFAPEAQNRIEAVMSRWGRCSASSPSHASASGAPFRADKPREARPRIHGGCG